MTDDPTLLDDLTLQYVLESHNRAELPPETDPADQYNFAIPYYLQGIFTTEAKAREAADEVSDEPLVWTGHADLLNWAYCDSHPETLWRISINILDHI